MRIVLSKLIREVKVVTLDEGIEHMFVRPGLKLIGAKKNYIESSDYDDVASPMLEQGFRFAFSQGADG